jgi:hypothetical protein
MTDVEALRARWLEHDQKLDVSIRLSRQLLTERTFDRARTALRRQLFWLALECVALVAGMGALAGFIGHHLDRPELVVPAGFLHLTAIARLISLVQQSVATLRIDYGRPVAVIQRQLEALTLTRIRHLKWALLIGMIAWTPFLIVVCQGLLGVDPYQVFSSAWLAANLLLALALIPLTRWGSKRYADRMQRSPAMQRFMRDLAGSNLNAAHNFLKTLADFEDERSDQGGSV